MNTWPPFFSLVCVPLALLAAPTPYLARGCWILLNFALLLLVLRILARLVYGRDMSLRATSGDLHPTSPELLVPLILSSRYVLGNFEHQQVNILTFALALGGLYLHANRRELLGGVCLGAAAALKVMAVLFIPYLVYRRQWRTALSAAATTAALSLSPILVFGPTRFWEYVGAWRAAVEEGWGVGKMNQSVYAMIDRWIGHGMVPFSVMGADGIPASDDPRVVVGVALLAAIVALLGLAIFRDGGRRGSWPDLAEWSVVFICSAIFGPVSWKAYLVVLLLPNTLLFAAWRSSRAGRGHATRGRSRAADGVRPRRTHDAGADREGGGEQARDDVGRDARGARAVRGSLWFRATLAPRSDGLNESGPDEGFVRAAVDTFAVVGYGATQGAPRQTSVTLPPVCRKSDFCCRATGELRGSECGSAPVIGAVLVIGGVAAPLSQMTGPSR